MGLRTRRRRRGRHKFTTIEVDTRTANAPKLLIKLFKDGHQTWKSVLLRPRCGPGSLTGALQPDVPRPTGAETAADGVGPVAVAGRLARAQAEQVVQAVRRQRGHLLTPFVVSSGSRRSQCKTGSPKNTRSCSRSRRHHCGGRGSYLSCGNVEPLEQGRGGSDDRLSRSTDCPEWADRRASRPSGTTAPPGTCSSLILWAAGCRCTTHRPRLKPCQSPSSKGSKGR